MLVGDLMLDRGVRKSVARNGQNRYGFLFRDAFFLRDADVTFGNLEGPISDKGKDRGGLYSFRMHPQVAQVLAWNGFDILSIANNHIGDYGREALKDTLDILNKFGVQAVGGGGDWEEASRLKILDVKGEKIGFLAFSDVGPEWLAKERKLPTILLAGDKERVDLIKRAASSTDYLVVSFHFGNEYAEKPSPRQQFLAREAIDLGAKVVVGHHSHVLQPVEEYGDGLIAYSLGNFIFDQDFSAETMQGGVLEINLEGGRIREYKLATTSMNAFFQPSVIINR